MKLHISDSLSLPLDAVTQTFAILAKRGVGKTHTASVMAEEMLKVGQPIVVYDPTGAWYGLKSSKDGKSAGYAVVVFGGEHADVPLEETAGNTIASVIVERRFPAILDCSLLRKGARIRFMTDFCETLYHKNREALHFFVDEAQTIAPQNLKAMPEAARLLGAMEDIVLQGRRRGLGLTIISPRPAVVNTNLRSACEVIIAMQTIAPHDRDAISEWIDLHGDDEDRAKEMMDSLSSLRRGQAWIWSPSWLNIFKQIMFRDRETFDSSATPEVGHKAIVPKKMAEIDLASLGEQIKATVEKAKQDDPRELRKKIAELERQMRQRPVEKIPEPQIVEVPVLTNGQLDRAHELVGRMIDFKDKVITAIAELSSTIQTAQRKSPKQRASMGPIVSPQPIKQREPRERHEDNGDVRLTKLQQRILDAIAWYESLGIMEPMNMQVGAVALVDATGGYWSNSVGPLSSAALVERGVGTIRLTDEGRRLARPIEHSGSLDAYHDVLRQRIRRMKSAGGKTIDILNFIIAANGETVSTEAIGNAIGVDHTGGYFSNCIGPLGTVGVITRNRGLVSPTDILFPPGLSK